MGVNNAVDLSAFEGVTTPADAVDLQLSSTTDPPPAPETPPAKPEAPATEPVKPEPSKAPADPEEKQPVASAAALLEDLERLVQGSSAFEEPAEPAKPEKPATPAEPAKPSAEVDELQAQIDEMDDGPEKEVVKRMLERMRAAEAREAERQQAALEEATAQALNEYVGQVKQFAKDFPGAKGEDLETVASRHAALVEQNEAMSELTFEEVARRVHGSAALEAWRAPAPRPAPAPKTEPAPPNGRTPGHPVNVGLGTGAPGDKTSWQPGPGRGFKDVSDHLVKEGAFRAVITKS